MNVNQLKTQRYWFEKYPRITLVGITLLVTIVILVLAELGVRMFRPEWAPVTERVFWVYDELFGWTHKPGQRGRFIHRDFSVEISINSRGLRDTEYTLERNDKKRMLILGDSFSWGYGVQHHERFSEILENNYSDWEIINASVSGYGTDQQFLYLKEEGLFYKPDVVLLLFNKTDFGNNINKEQYWYNKPYFILEDESLQLQNIPVPKTTLRQKLDRFFIGKTYFWKVIYYLIIYNTIRKGGRHNQKKAFQKQNKYEVTYQLIKAMNDLARKNGAKFILVSIPMIKKSRNFLQDLSAKLDISYLPLDAFFSNIEKTVTFPHDSHWNSVGHEAAAIAIDQFLQDLKIF
jgi:hypothetical protein